MKTIEKIDKLTNEKFLNLYKIRYNVDGKPYSYQVASRKDISSLAVNKNSSADAVRILPYFKKDGKIYIVVIKEFRYAVNKYLYGTPAGLIDEGEDGKASAIRELKEEIGANVIKIEKIQNKAYSSAGLSDESLEFYEAEIKLDDKQSLEEFEDIKVEIVEFKDLLNFVDSHNFCLQSALHLKLFYYKNLKEM